MNENITNQKNTTSCSLPYRFDSSIVPISTKETSIKEEFAEGDEFQKYSKYYRRKTKTFRHFNNNRYRNPTDGYYNN